MRTTSRSAAAAPADPSTGTRTLATRRGGPYAEPARGADGITRTGRQPTWITFVVTDPVIRLPTAPAPCDPIAIIAQSSISAARAIAVAASPNRTVVAHSAAAPRRSA